MLIVVFRFLSILSSCDSFKFNISKDNSNSPSFVSEYSNFNWWCLTIFFFWCCNSASNLAILSLSSEFSFLKISTSPSSFRSPAWSLSSYSFSSSSSSSSPPSSLASPRWSSSSVVLEFDGNWKKLNMFEVLFWLRLPEFVIGEVWSPVVFWLSLISIITS